MLAACQVLYQQAVVALPTRRSFTDLQLSARISAKLPMIVVTRWPAVRNRSQRSPGLRFATPVCRVCCLQKGGFMGFGTSTGQRFAIVGELFSFFLKNKRGWIAPILVILVLCGILVIFAESSAIATFIYSMF